MQKYSCSCPTGGALLQEDILVFLFEKSRAFWAKK
jgi:hypothetical protein